MVYVLVIFVFQVIFLHLSKAETKSFLPSWVPAQQGSGRWDTWPWAAFLGILLPDP